MALQTSGIITLSDIQNEFGGVNPIGLSEYYRGGAYTTGNNTNVPTSGAISLSNFYGATNQFSFIIAATIQNANLATLATSAGWDGSAPLSVVINSGYWLWSDTTSSGGLIIPSSIPNGVTLYNYGYIIGRGGNGGGFAGGPAIQNSASNVSIVNLSGAYIAGGGGGGAGWNGSQGGGGGAGGGDAGGAGGAINTAGADGWVLTYGGDNGSGGGAGGGGGYGGGGGGGRILPGVGGAGGLGGGNGGSGGSAGANGSFAPATSTHSGGGGGGWGAKGGNSSTGALGGAGGAAISGTSVSLTNNGTIYGAVA
jgi:hypothetical protein